MSTYKVDQLITNTNPYKIIQPAKAIPNYQTYLKQGKGWEFKKRYKKIKN